ncbi:MAG: AAA family ATPase [Myxococcales bacterium]|nr:AAA family ATPase [Myxococcales bacterium]
MSPYLHFFTGKGGVGKSTLVAAWACAAQEAGERVLVVELSAHSSLRALLQHAGLSLHPEESEGNLTAPKPLFKEIWSLSLQPEMALLDYVQTYVRSRRWAEQIVQHPALQRFFRAAPAVAEVLLLEKLLRLSEEVGPDKRWNRLLVDLDATGHALMFLELHRTLWGLLGKSPLRKMLERGRALLSDPERCRLHIVTLLQALPAQECRALYEALQARFDLPLGALLLNQTLPPLFSQEALPFEHWREQQPSTSPQDDAPSSFDTQTLLQFLQQQGEIEEEATQQRSFLAQHVPLPAFSVPSILHTPFSYKDLLLLGKNIYPALLQVKPTMPPQAPNEGQEDTIVAPASPAQEPQETKPTPAHHDETEEAQEIDSPLQTQDAQHLAEGLFQDRELLVFLGPGGVGKTTLAAACAVAAAKAGRRVMLLTIDPAKRLADALGLGDLDDKTREVPLTGLKTSTAGSLHAAMLETQSSYDALIERLTQDDQERRKLIFENRVYKAFSRTLARSHAYVAMERLYAEMKSEQYDLIILDTPPTQNALDILDAPGHLSRFLEDSIVTGFLQTRRGIGQRLFQSGSLLAQTLLSLLLGRELTRNISDFFDVFLDLRGGFQERATEVQSKLLSPQSGFVLVGTPDSAQGGQAGFLLEQILERQLPLASLWLNRAFQPLPPLDPQAYTALYPNAPSSLQEHQKAWNQALALRLRQLHKQQQQHRDELESFLPKLPETTTSWGFPKMTHDICDIQGLAHLFAACHALAPSKP